MVYVLPNTTFKTFFKAVKASKTIIIDFIVFKYSKSMFAPCGPSKSYPGIRLVKDDSKPGLGLLTKIDINVPR